MKPKKKGQKYVSTEPTAFIPNIWLSVNLGASNDTEHHMRSAFCIKDKVQWFYLVKSQKGFSDFEPIKCEFCNGPLWRDGFESGFSASDTPEVIAWLQEHPEEKKTLILAYTQFSLEHLKRNLLDHLLKHNFSGLYEKLMIIQHGQSSPQKLKHLNKKELLQSCSLLTIKDKKKQNGKNADRATIIGSIVSEALELEKHTKESKKDRLRREKYSKLAKVVLENMQNAIILPNNLHSYKIFKKNQEILNLQLPMMNLRVAATNLRRLRFSIPKEVGFPLAKLSDSILAQQVQLLSESEQRIKRLLKKRRENMLVDKRKRDLSFLRSL